MIRNKQPTKPAAAARRQRQPQHREEEEEEDCGAALTARSSKPLRRRRRLGINKVLNVIPPKKKQLGPAKEEEKYGAASMDKSCSQPKPNVGRRAVKLIAPKKKRANDAVVVKAAENAGRVLTAEWFK